MKEKKRLEIVVGIICVVALLVGTIFFYKEIEDEKTDITKEKEVVSNENMKEVKAESKLDTKKIYNEKNQKKIKDSIDKKKASKNYTEDDMLLLEDPYGTNSLSLYAYFNTKEDVSIKYTIHVENKKIKDFTRTLKNSGKNNLTKVHEYQIIGMIPNVENKITFTFTKANGESYKKNINYKMKNKKGNEELILKSKKGSSKEKLTNGLYVILGNDSKKQDYMYYYDNNGVLRGEVPVINYRSHRLLFKGQKMYYSISHSEIAEVNNLGQVTKIYNLGKYELHHDYVFEDDENLLILATNTEEKYSVEDYIIKLNLTNGKVTEIINLEDYFKDYKKICKKNKKGNLDWMHLNTIQYMGNDEIIVSARETSSIIKFSNISKKPKLEYMLGEKSFWKNTKYTKYLFKKDGKFKGQTGQHSITYVKDKKLKKGQYYMYLYDNNIGISVSRPDYKWSQIKGVGSSGTKGTKSMYYKYLVDENKKTYRLIKSIDVDYSGYVSSVQEIGNNVVIDSGNAYTFYEFDKNSKLINSYYMKGETYIYRVYKYTFDEFYFKK